MKNHKVLRCLLIDVLCAGVALVVFALFHHVLPRQQSSVGTRLCQLLNKTAEKKSAESKEISINPLLF